jgi:hypothetical protein
VNATLDADAARLARHAGRDCDKAMRATNYVVKVRDKEIRTALTTTSLERHARCRKVGAARSTTTTATSCNG